MADHRHRGDRREPRDPVGSVLLDRVHVRRRDHLGGVGPAHPDQPALAAGALVAAAAFGIGLDVGPRRHRVTEAVAGLAVHLDEHAARVGVAHPGRRVRVPGERGPAWAPARLVLGTVGTDRRVVGFLCLPGDHAVLDVDLPGARPGAVHPVGGAHHLVVAPPVAVEDVAVATAHPFDRTPVAGNSSPREEPSAAHQQVFYRSTNSVVRQGILLRSCAGPARVRAA